MEQHSIYHQYHMAVLLPCVHKMAVHVCSSTNLVQALSSVAINDGLQSLSSCTKQPRLPLGVFKLSAYALQQCRAVCYVLTHSVQAYRAGQVACYVIGLSNTWCMCYML